MRLPALPTPIVRLLAIATCVCVCGRALAGAPTPDPRLDVVATLFREFGPSLDRFGVEAEAALPGGLRLVVVHAMTSPDKVDRSLQGEDFFRQEAYGAFVFDAGGHLRLTVDIFRSHRWGDGQVHILSADVHSCLLKYWGATYGMDFGTRKYFYDLDERRVLNRVVHFGFSVRDMAHIGGAVYFLADDGRVRRDPPSVALRLDSVERVAEDEAYTVITSIQGQPIPAIGRMVADGETLALQTKERQYALSDGTWEVGANPDASLFAGVREGYLGVPDDMIRGPRYLLESRTFDSPDGRHVLGWSGGSSGVYDMTVTPPRFYGLPRPGLEELAEHRPVVADTLRGRESYYEFRASIGAFQQEDGRIWFGTSFYDGEGLIGVGAAGYFDTHANAYHLIYDAALGDWSCTALLVERDALWIGLASQPEGAQRPGGLARYDRESGVFTLYDIPAVVNVIRRYGQTLFVGTAAGVYALDATGLRHVALDFDVTGGYVVEVTRIAR